MTHGTYSKGSTIKYVCNPVKFTAWSFRGGNSFVINGFNDISSPKMHRFHLHQSALLFPSRPTHENIAPHLNSMDKGMWLQANGSHWLWASGLHYRLDNQPMLNEAKTTEDV